MLDFQCLEWNWNYPLIAPLALSFCIASILRLYFYAKSLSCILNTSLNPSQLTLWQNSLPRWFHLLPPHTDPVRIQMCQHHFLPDLSPPHTAMLWLPPGCVFGLGGVLHPAAPAPWVWFWAGLCFWAGRSCMRASVLLQCRHLSSASAFMDYWWNSLVQFGCLIDKARMKKKKEKNINTKLSTLCIQCLFFLA